MNGTVHSWFRGYVWRWLMALTLRIGCRCLQGTRDDIVEERSHPQFMAIETWNMMIKHIVSLGVPIFWDIPRWSQMNKGNQKYKLRFHSRWSHGFSLVVIMFSPSHCGIGCQNAVKIHDISLFLIWSMYDCLNMFIAGQLNYIAGYSWFDLPVDLCLLIDLFIVGHHVLNRHCVMCMCPVSHVLFPMISTHQEMEMSAAVPFLRYPQADFETLGGWRIKDL